MSKILLRQFKHAKTPNFEEKTRKSLQLLKQIRKKIDEEHDDIEGSVSFKEGDYKIKFSTKKGDEWAPCMDP